MSATCRTRGSHAVSAVCCSLLVVLLAFTPAFAQSGGDYVITKSTIDGGGVGDAVGGDYLMSGTVGQHDATELSGGDYFLTGGFWSPAGVPVALDPPTAEPGGVGRNRFVSFVVPTSSAGTDTALRVEFDAIAAPPGAPSGRQFRYVNAFGFDGTNPGVGSLTCPDAAPTFPDYACARLGCEPEYRDWGAAVGGVVLHVTGDAVVPGSTYEVSHIASSCGAAPAADACVDASAGLPLATAVWGDIVGPGSGPPDGAANVLDIGAAVDKVKGLATAFPEPRVWLKNQQPTPDADPINVLDIGFTVDAVKGLTYPFTIAACP